MRRLKIADLSYWFLSLSRHIKVTLLMAMDSCFVLFALWLAFSLRLGLCYFPSDNIWQLFLISPFIAIPIFSKLGLYRAIIRYIGGRALWAIFKAVAFYALLFTVVIFLFGQEVGLVPRIVPLLNWLVLLLFVGGSRLIARWWLTDAYSRQKMLKDNAYCGSIVIIYGAGSAGAQLASALEYGDEQTPVAFIDDDELLHKQKVNGLRIYPLSSLDYLIERHKVTDVLIAMPSTTRACRSNIIRLLEPYPVHVRLMPGMSDMAQGRVKFDELQEVDIADLLGRNVVDPDPVLFHANITDKVILVTGAGGSIGSELCRQIILLQPTKLILLELNEFALYALDKELNHTLSKLNQDAIFDIVAVLGSITDEIRVSKVCKAFSVQTIYHTAAYKHVPLVEHNPAEAIKNNIFGTLSVANAAISTGVETFVLISTDKAVRPTSIMGATKRFAELLLQGLSLEQNHQTRFTMVRFGNVLGSSGSVIPLFREQIARGGPVTVTDARIIRYFMTIPEAAQLVIQAGAMGTGGEVFVLDMGDPIRILELAKRMIHLSGLEIKDDEHPEGEVEISFTGLRAGEKLYEELLIGDNVTSTAHSQIMCANEEVINWDDLNDYLQQLNHAVKNDKFELMRDILKQSVSGFIPQCEVRDLLWKMEQK